MRQNKLINKKLLLSSLIGAMVLGTLGCGSKTETVRVAIGTQDTTINCATGGLLIRELNLLPKYLPKDGKYRHVKYDIQWKNFTSGAPLTSEMVAGRLDLGAMADFPAVNNLAAFKKAGKESIFLAPLSGSINGSGNAIVVPIDSKVTSLKELKGQTISVPFASTAHGLLLRAIQAEGWQLDKDIKVIAQAPEVAGPALKSHKISAQQHPEVIKAYLQATIEANRLIQEQPEKYSELIAEKTGIPAEVVYLFHGPLGLQTRDLTWKSEYRKATQIAIDTLKVLGKNDGTLDVNKFIDDQYIKDAFQASGLNYSQQLSDYAKSPLVANDALTGQPIKTFDRVTQIWVKGEEKVRSYETPEHAFSDLKKIQADGKTVRVVYSQDHQSDIKLLANLAWYATDKAGQIQAFLLKDEAEKWAKQQGGKVYDFKAIQLVTQS